MLLEGVATRRVVAAAVAAGLCGGGGGPLVGVSVTSAATLPIAGPCIPGITAERCRGVFWETGKLYKKPSLDVVLLSPAEYTDALHELDDLRAELRRLGGLADDGKAGEAGAAAARARIAIRQAGDRVISALAGDDRIDGTRRLRSVVRALDDVDVESLSEPAQGAATASGFAPLRLMLDGAASRLDDFRSALPTELEQLD
mmetsp:Transcript_38423/g.101305  ORF Transcript_38423/g.101305 Transcript_38423/m.101305 type:complete len:201 (-) Transcript_38423:379-981(-)